MKHQDAVKLLAEKRTRSEIADFLLTPGSRPDLSLELFLSRAQTRRPRAQAPAASSWVRLLLRGGIFVVIITALSCAVGHHNGDNPLSVKDETRPEETKPGDVGVEPMNTAVSAAWDTAWTMVAGSALPDPLAESFAGRLFKGDWAGLFLLDPDGRLKAVAKPETYNVVTQWLERHRTLEDENTILRETMEALSEVQDAEKIYLEINIDANRIYAKMGTQVLYDFPVVTGKGYATRESGSIRRFQTPRGILSVIEKQVDPVWIPPAWNWTERGLTPPAVRPALRGHLGKYRLLFPDAIGIHGTSAGRINPGKYSHGCIRMNARDLKIVYDLADVGTELYVY